MEMAVTISLRVSIAEEGANLNEMCAALGKLSGQLSGQLGREFIHALQEETVDGLVTGEAPVDWGSHDIKGGGGPCRCRCFRRQGTRSRERKVKTEVGEISFLVAYVECRDCGKRLAPILRVLGLSSRSRHTVGLERAVCDAVAETSYQ